MLYIWLFDKMQGINVMVECRWKDLMPTLRAYPARRYDFVTMRTADPCVKLARLR